MMLGHTQKSVVVLPQKQEASADILQAMNALKEGGATPKWGAALQEPFQRRNVFMGELKRAGVLNPQAIGIASTSAAPSQGPVRGWPHAAHLGPAAVHPQPGQEGGRL